MNTLSQIHAHEDRLLAAQIAHDITELDNLIHDDLFFHGPDGSMFTKQMDLEAHRSGQFIIDQLEHLERDIRLLSNDVVLASVLAETEGQVSGVPAKGRLRYLRVWQRFGNGWKVVGGSMAMLP